MGLSYQTVTIPINQTDSDYVQLARNTIVGIRMPSAFTGTSITILESDSSGGVYSPINPSGNGATYTVTAGQTIGIPANNAACALFAKVRSSSAEASAREIVIITRTIGE